MSIMKPAPWNRIKEVLVDVQRVWIHSYGWVGN